MSTEASVAAATKPQLLGQTVVVIGGSAGIGLETARRARAEGAEVVLTGRDPERLEQRRAGARAPEQRRVRRHRLRCARAVLRRAPGAGRPRAGHRRPARTTRRCRTWTSRRRAATRASICSLPIQVARHAVGKVRPGGTLLFMGGTGARRRASGSRSPRRSPPRCPRSIANLALEIAPIRVNLIAAGFVDTPLSAPLLGDQLEARREQLRATLPIGRVVGPADVAALAVHLMANTALTGATYDIDGGQQLI